MRVWTPQERFAASAMAREDLYFFSRWMFLRRKGYQWQRARHHALICKALERVFRGECRRLVINVPPRYSKTELAVINFIAWAMGKVPDSEFIHVSYSGALAINNSAQVRTLVQHEAYEEMFPHLALASEASHHWKTTAGGVMYATGTGGTITGFGAGKHREGFGGAIVVDDAHKADEARSDVMRNSVLDWYQNTLESRKNSPETPIVVIGQRLHEKDLPGWLLSGGNGEQWESLVLSAWQDDGTPLWPEKHSADELVRMERASPYHFSGQYRQRPAPPEGGIFKPDQLQVIEALPAVPIEWVRGWDLAATEQGATSADPDWTAGGKLGRLQDGRFVIADMVRLRSGPDERDAALRNTGARDGKKVRISLPQDPGQAGKTQALYLTRMLAGYRVHTSPESGDKVTRAEPLAAQVNVGNVLMLKAPWNDELINEMRMFPNGAHEDQVDALSRASEALMGGSTGMLDWARQQAEAAEKAKEAQDAALSHPQQ